MKNVNVILLCLMRKKRGNWEETQNAIGAELMSEFENAGYLSRVDNEWHMPHQGKLLALHALAR